MAHSPISRSAPFDPPQPSAAPVSPDANESNELEDGLSLTELATALSSHGGGDLSADLALDLVLNEIVEHARLATGATAAAIALVRGDEIVCRATTGANAPDLGVRLDVHSGLSGACVQTKMWQRCDDTETDSRVDAEVCRSLGVRSILVFPVVKDDTLLGVFEIFSPRPDAFSDREIQTLRALSRNIVNNVDRAADVLAPPVPVVQSSTAATIAATATEVQNIDQMLVEHPPDEVLQPETLVPPIEPSAEGVTTRNVMIPPRDRWMGVLTVMVIAMALFLGWTMGYVGRQKAPAGAKARAAANATALPATSKPPESARSEVSATPVPASDQPVPLGTLTAPASSEKIGVGVVPAGGLVVYENGKVIYRTPSQSSHRSARDESVTSQPIMVPSKVADEYLVQRVEPDYPEQAREEHIQGAVVLVALVGKDGAVEKLSTISGDSQLVAAATDAVLQWRFKPFFRNGSPEEFQTQITVSFRLP